MKTSKKIIILILFIQINLSISLTQTEINDYTYWINIRNSIEFDSNQLARTARLYRPEDSSYESTLNGYGVILYVLSGLSILILILYLIGRFGFNSFIGGKTVKTSRHLKLTSILIILGLIISIILYSISIDLYLKNDKGNETVKKLIKTENSSRKLFLDDLSLIENELKSVKFEGIPNNSLVLSYKDYSLLNENVSEMMTKRERFINDYKNSEDIPYVLYIVSISILVSFTIITLMIRFLMKNSVLIEIISVILLVFVGLSFFFQSIIFKNFFKKIDFCSEVNNVLQSERIIISGKGIGLNFPLLSSKNSLQMSINKFDFLNCNDLVYDFVTQKKKELTFNKSLINDIDSSIKTLNPSDSIDEAIISALKLMISYNKFINLLEKESIFVLSNESLLFSFENNVCKGLSSNFYMILLSILAIFFSFPLIYGLNRLAIGLYKNKNMNLIDDNEDFIKKNQTFNRNVTVMNAS